MSVDFFPKINPAKSISAFGERNPLYGTFDFGGGVAVIYKPSDLIALQVGYGDYSFKISDPNNGLFKDLSTGRKNYGGQLTFTPNKSLTLGLLYVHYYSQFLGPVLNITGGTGSLFAQAPFGQTTPTMVNGFGIQASNRFSDRFALSGWVGYIKARSDSSGQVDGLNVSPGEKADIWNWAVTMAFPNFGKQGSQFNFVFGTPPWVANNDVTSRIDRGRSYHIEASYNYPLAPRLFITPGFFVIINPEHNSNNDNIWLGTIRTTLYF